MTVPDSPWVYLLGLIISTGFLKYIVDIYREYRARQKAAPPPSAVRQAEIDHSMVTMAKVNEALEADNTRLRETNREATQQIRELNDLLTAERAGRATDREGYQREIRTLEARVRQMGDEHQRVYSDLLNQITALREKHDTGDIPAVGGGFSRTPATTNDPYQPYDHSITEIRED